MRTNVALDQPGDLANCSVSLETPYDKIPSETPPRAAGVLSSPQHVPKSPRIFGPKIRDFRRLLSSGFGVRHTVLFRTPSPFFNHSTRLTGADRRRPDAADAWLVDDHEQRCAKRTPGRLGFPMDGGGQRELSDQAIETSTLLRRWTPWTALRALSMHYAMSTRPTRVHSRDVLPTLHALTDAPFFLKNGAVQAVQAVQNPLRIARSAKTLSRPSPSNVDQAADLPRRLISTHRDTLRPKIRIDRIRQFGRSRLAWAEVQRPDRYRATHVGPIEGTF